MNYQLAKHVSLTDVDDEAVLLDLNTGAYYGLNHVGAKLLKELQGGQSIEQASQTIAEQYQMPYASVANDIQDLLTQLLDQKLLDRQEP